MEAPADPGAGLVRSAQTLIDAAAQAVEDYARLIEHEVTRRRESELGAARLQADVIMTRAQERSDTYAAAQRARLTALGDERDRLVERLRAQVDSAARHADDAALTRAEIYRVIGKLGRAPLDLNGDGADHVPANGNGARNGGGNGDGASDAPRLAPQSGSPGDAVGRER